MAFDPPEIDKTVIRKRCVEPDCDREFIITAADVERCKENKWQLPIRCQPCRDRRRKWMEKPPTK